MKCSGIELEGAPSAGRVTGANADQVQQIEARARPTLSSVADDPTLKNLNGVRLSGSYDFDDEGVPASRVQAVDHGVLKNFLMSRMPIDGWKSVLNGHTVGGRRA